jgi:hypothetical protein
MDKLELKCVWKQCGNVDLVTIHFDQPIHDHAMPHSAYHHPYLPIHGAILSAAGVDGMLSYSRYTCTIEPAKMLKIEDVIENVRVAVEASLNCRQEKEVLK